MPKRPDYSDRLRETLLGLALIPLAGLQTASYWLRESLERTSRLATDAMQTTALGRSGPSLLPADAANAVTDVMTQDLLDAARLYVRSMVRLPADSAIYFTEEMERTLNALLEKIQPDAAKDLDGYLDHELENVRNELDRLFLIAGAQAGHLTGSQAHQAAIVRKINDLRALTKQLRDELTPRPPDALPLPPPENVRALLLYKTREKLEAVLREAESLLPADHEALATIRTAIERGLQPTP